MKYIVKIKPEYKDSFKGLMVLGAKDNNLFVDVLAVDDLELLNSDYINENFGQLQDTAYQKGFEDGKKTPSELASNAEYQRGLDDAWEAAKKIFGYEMDGGIPIDEIRKVFGYAEDAIFCTADIIRHNTAAEAINKIKAYEEKQKAADEIKVGDVVIYNGTTKCLVVAPQTDEKYASLFDCNGMHYYADYRECKKTGKHFDISKILKEMTND